MLRRAKIEDASAILAVHMASIRALAAGSYSPQQIEAWCGAREPKDYFAPILEKLVFVAMDGEDILGFSQLDLKQEIVEAVYVHPTQTRRGIGIKLLVALEDEAKMKGIVKLTLSASLNAVEFYTRAGYRVGTSQLHQLRPGVAIPCVHMSRNLLARSGA